MGGERGGGALHLFPKGKKGKGGLLCRLSFVKEREKLLPSILQKGKRAHRYGAVACPPPPGKKKKKGGATSREREKGRDPNGRTQGLRLGCHAGGGGEKKPAPHRKRKTNLHYKCKILTQGNLIGHQGGGKKGRGEKGTSRLFAGGKGRICVLLIGRQRLLRKVQRKGGKKGKCSIPGGEKGTAGRSVGGEKSKLILLLGKREERSAEPGTVIFIVILKKGGGVRLNKGRTTRQGKSAGGCCWERRTCLKKGGGKKNAAGGSGDV